MAGDETCLSIDGGIMEGGGQILRIATSLSAIMNVPVRISNIRGNRPKPGLRPQHLTGLQVLRDLVGGKLEGGYIDCTEIKFTPSSSCEGFDGKEFIGDTGTAGSVMLLLQVSLPPVLYFAKPAPEMVFKGGTNADFAPPVDYTTNVLLPILKEFGIDCRVSLERRGFYPKGGGKIRVSVSPLEKFLRPLQRTKFGRLLSIVGKAQVAGNLPMKIAQEMATAAKNLCCQGLSKLDFANNTSVDVTAVQSRDNSVGSCAWLDLVAKTDEGVVLGSSALLNKGERGSAAGERCAKELLAEIEVQSCVDSRAVDQLIVFMTLAKGTSAIRCKYPLSLHAETAMHIAEKVVPNVRFEVKDKEGGGCLLQCVGVGHERA